MSKGDRNLSMFDFFEVLQLEFIIAELRKKIYPKKKDKDFYKKVMDEKKRRIEDISFKNHNLPSIFNDQSKREEKYREIYQEYGPPIFMYKDNEQKVEQENKDFYYYYYPESEVKFIDEEKQIKIGTIKICNLKAKIVEIELKDTTTIRVVDIEKITRIL